MTTNKHGKILEAYHLQRALILFLHGKELSKQVNMKGFGYFSIYPNTMHTKVKKVQHL